VIKGMAHITGGGITENLPRVLPEGTAARIHLDSWEVPPVFRFLQRAGAVPDDEMRRTFNLGIGLIVVCDEASALRVLQRLAEAGEEDAARIGRVVEGDRGVAYAP
jgi:phosphoribosylformylglycinamidine cyclo-ligase